MHKRPVFGLLLLLLVLAACKYKLDDRPSWDADFVAPLLRSSVSLEDAVKNSDVVQINPDQTVSIVYRDTLINIALADYFVVPDTSLNATVTLDSISLTTGTVSRSITLREMLDGTDYEFVCDWGFLPPINPPQTIAGGPASPIDASDYFDEAWLREGALELKIQNNTPIDFHDVIFKLCNDSLCNNIVAADTITIIPKNGGSVTSQVSLAGKYMQSTLYGKLDSLTIGPTNNTTNIDCDQDHVKVDVVLSNMKADSAIAVFPAQTVIDNTQMGNYDFGKDIKISRLTIKSGKLKISGFNSVQNPLELIYSLPTAVNKSGQTITQVSTLPAAPDAFTPSSFNEEFDLSGYSIDLTLDGDSTNKFPQDLMVNLIYTGNKVKMTVKDKIEVTYSLVDIVPSYIEGYLGKTEFAETGGSGFGAFESVLGGTLDLANPSAGLTFSNSIGVDGELEIKDLTGYNGRTNQSVSLVAADLQGATTIPGPKLPNVGQSVSSFFKLDKSNSNIRDLLSVMPDSLVYDIAVSANKNGNPNRLDNFATDKSAIAAMLDVEVPLHGIADQIRLETNVDLNISEANLSDKIKQGKLNLLVENYFPFETRVQLYFYNAGGALVDSLFQPGDYAVIPAGSQDASGQVTEPAKGKLGAFFDGARLDKLRQQGHSARVKFTLSTKPSGTNVKIYSTYRIDFKLVGDFRYEIGL